MAIDCAKSVLLVEDSKTVAQIVRGQLTQIGFKDVDLVTDGHEALARMSAKRYGLVISDWNMSPMGGYELLKLVRSDPALKRTPFIMITSDVKANNVVAAKNASVDNFIVKPFSVHVLRDKVEATLAFDPKK